MTTYAEHNAYGSDRATWLEKRRRGIGGSDAPALVGVDPWASPFTVWQDKTGRSLDDLGNEAMEWGNLLEPVIAHVWERREGRRLIRPSDVVAHPEHPWMLASIDRFIVDDDMREVGVFEAKTTSARNERDWDFDDGIIPERVVVQGQHYLAVTDLPVCEVAALIGGQTLRTCTIRRDERLIEGLIEVERRFWHDHVLADKPPPIDGHRATTDAIGGMFPTASPEREVDLPYDANRFIIAYRDADQRMKAARADKDEAANELRMLLEDASVGRIDGMVAVTWKEQTSRALDRGALRAAHPDLVDQFTNQVTTRVLRLVKGYQP